MVFFHDFKLFSEVSGISSPWRNAPVISRESSSIRIPFIFSTFPVHLPEIASIYFPKKPYAYRLSVFRRERNTSDCAPVAGTIFRATQKPRRPSAVPAIPAETFLLEKPALPAARKWEIVPLDSSAEFPSSPRPSLRFQKTSIRSHSRGISHFS